MSFVYHLCAKDFQGEILYPLNDLRTHFPEVFRREVEKWNGRESVLEYKVPWLGTTWANAVNLSALNPKLLVEERRRLGVPFSRLLERRLVSIPIERLEGLPCVHFRGSSYWLNSSPGDLNVPATPPENEFTPFRASEYMEEQEVPEFHREYLIRQKERGELALGFVGIPHVLVGGPIDLRGLEFTSLTP